MTIDPATDIVALNADVVRIWTAVAPPFGRSEQSDDRSPGGDRQVSGSRITADVKCRLLCQCAKTF